MARAQQTDYVGNPAASQYHRILGRSIYASDVDMIEYTYKNDQIKLVAVIDWKYPGEKLGDQQSSIKLRQTIASLLKVPFFVVITYLDEQYPVKMLYTIPLNDYARSYYTKCELALTGHWFSLRQFSKFQHALRGLRWNGEEEILSDNILAVGLEPGLKLKDLSKRQFIYPLPKLEF